MDVGAPEEVPLPRLPLAGARVAVRLHDAARRRHEQGPGEVGGGLGEDVRRVRDDHLPALCRGDVDVVVANRDVGDDLEGRRRRQHLIVDRADDVADQTASPLQS